MNIHDRKQRHDRAMAIFQAEDREQTLSGIALRQAAIGTEGATDAVAPIAFDPRNPVSGLHAIACASEANILNAHRQIQAARIQAARMAASDPELARLNTLIDGPAPEPSGAQPITIEGEAMDVTTEPAEAPPLIDKS